MLDAVHDHFHSLRRGLGHRLLAIAQPLLHGGDLVTLSVDDPVAQRMHRRTRTVTGGPAGHYDGLGMVADHSRHEVDIGGRIWTPSAVLPRLGDGGYVGL